MWPFHYVLTEGKELPTRYVSRNELVLLSHKK
jgi:hypothetical protein